MKDRISFFGDLLSYLRWGSTLKTSMLLVRHRQKDKNSKKRILVVGNGGCILHYYFFDGRDLKAMLVGAVNRLGQMQSEIDALNVFPVPDGDTGTNMYLTLLGGVKEIPEASTSVGAVAEAVARGCLLGARGNSGVILSQIVRGFADALADKEQAGVEEVVRAFALGAEYAYRAVANPLEGTILTVGKAISQAASEAGAKTRDLLRVIVYACRQAQLALERTPELLPVLKEAGVVDAGGKGLVVILEGIIQALKDLAVDRDIQLFDLAAAQQKQFASLRRAVLSAGLEYTYCTEFVLVGQNLPLQALKRELAPYGDCLLVVGNEKTAKVHLHSNHPGLVLECGLKYGALLSVHINNMEEQCAEGKQFRSSEKRPVGVIAVGPGEGLKAILESLGADKVVDGGQTMNPSTQDLAAAIKEIEAEAVIILPNNKNILLAAEQAKQLADRPAGVVPSVSLPQGIAALMCFNPYASLEENLLKMSQAIGGVKTGEVTRAVRSARIKGQEIRPGDYMGLVEGEVAVWGANLAEVVRDTLELMLDGRSSLVTLYFGAGLTTSEAEELVKIMQQRFPVVDFELYYGGQALYPFIISVE